MLNLLQVVNKIVCAALIGPHEAFNILMVLLQQNLFTTNYIYIFHRRFLGISCTRYTYVKDQIESKCSEDRIQSKQHRSILLTSASELKRKEAFAGCVDQILWNIYSKLNAN